MENDHTTLCKETIKARFATLAQTQTLINNEVKVNKPVVIKKKSEVSVSKKTNEALKLPSFETFVSLPDAKPSQDVQGILFISILPRKIYQAPFQSHMKFLHLFAITEFSHLQRHDICFLQRHDV